VTIATATVILLASYDRVVANGGTGHNVFDIPPKDKNQGELGQAKEVAKLQDYPCLSISLET
jgi:hypothetical protein